jgi:hypothetical protein
LVDVTKIGMGGPLVAVALLVELASLEKTLTVPLLKKDCTAKK